MEVHHHSHTSDPDSHRGRKKWTHYFWEFLMLFLAVFCGFLAEYQLEHTIEKQRESQYASTLYEDMKADTAILKTNLRQISYVTERIDTFRMLVHAQAITSVPPGTWYYFGRFGTRNFQLSLQDATLEQLKSSGGLRYFKNRRVVDAIARYDQACRHMRISLDLQNIIYNELVKNRNMLFNGWYMDEIMDFDLSAVNIDSFKLASPPLLSTDKRDFIQYSNYCQLRSYNNKFLFRQIEKALQDAEIMLAELKTGYHLK
jgi:hypothetical protein